MSNKFYNKKLETCFSEITIWVHWREAVDKEHEHIINDKIHLAVKGVTK